MMRTTLLVAATVLAGAGSVGAQADAGEWFPSEAFAASEVASRFATALEVMYERPLVEGSDYAESYRFVWLRAFHDPVVVRLEVTPAGEGQVTTKILRGGAAQGRGELELVRSEWANPRRVRAFRRAVGEQGFWSLAVSGAARGLDGSLWLLEARDGRRYHAVERWSPADGPVRELGEELLRLGDAPRKPFY